MKRVFPDGDAQLTHYVPNVDVSGERRAVGLPEHRCGSLLAYGGRVQGKHPLHLGARIDILAAAADHQPMAPSRLTPPVAHVLSRAHEEREALLGERRDVTARDGARANLMVPADAHARHVHST